MSRPRSLLIVAVTGPSAKEAAVQLGAAAGFADMAEFRLDQFSSQELERLLPVAANASMPPVFTCRGPGDGGRFAYSDTQRASLLCRFAQAASVEALVDIEFGSALEGMMKPIPPERRLLSYHDFNETPPDPQGLLDEMLARPCAALKMVLTARSASDILAIPPLLERARERGKDLIAFSMGRHGSASRCLGPRWGSHAVFASAVEGRESAPGQLTAAALVRDYRFKAVGRETLVIAPIGDASEAEEPSRLYNRLFDRLGIDALCLPAIDTALPELAGLIERVPLKGAYFARSGPARHALRPGEEPWDTVVCGEDGGMVMHSSAGDRFERMATRIRSFFGIPVAPAEIAGIVG